ncbi:catalase [Aeromonas cavernicola]|uniref:Catalase n=1 Tax=Aeromonas cavernicola TaxID=1006623 RepID=A0A2H9U9L0_9GAMM|nr:catalase [Aeromonas cavernicola]PJG60711.1 catalase [Aeromonas cavernicola]
MKTVTKLAIGLASGLTLQVHAEVLTRDNGAPVGNNQHSTTAGPNGATLLQDVHLIQKLQRFARERIPERVVHARGTGAYGEFEVTRAIPELTSASLFAEKGKKTPVFVRFSTVIHGLHSPETLRDPRGFATKFYTDQGNWDLVGNNLPVFFIRDAIKFPDMVHSLKPSPVNNMQDPNRVFDFMSQDPASTHMLTQVYSDLGTPASYRKMDGFGVHAYKFVNPKGEVHYVKFNWRSQQGISSLDQDQVAKVQGQDFNHLTRDLYGAIEAGDAPKWDLAIQIIKPTQLNDFTYHPLDPTKIWEGVPEQKIGTMTLNRMPDNFFQETEQAAFAPANLVPGIEPSEDRLLQGRMFAYSDTQFYRLGANHQQLPVNRPLVAVISNNQDGAMNMGNTQSNVNYEPSSQAPKAVLEQARAVATPLQGTVQQLGIEKTDNFSQAGNFYRALDSKGKANLVRNLAADLGAVRDNAVKHKMLAHFYKADSDYGIALTRAVKGDEQRVKQIATQL